MQAIWNGSPNFSPGPRIIYGIVLHDVEGTLASALAVFSQPGGVSAHYIVDTDGTLHQCVQDADSAYHVAAFGNDPALNRNRPDWLPAYNGLYSAVNACTLGIELVGYASQGYTDAQYATLAALLAEKCQQYGLEPSLQPDAGAAARIVSHGWLQTDRSDPGPLFDWDRLRTALAPQEADVPTPAEQQILDAAARHDLDAAGIDQMAGERQTLGEQVSSLEWLLGLAQGERDAQAAEAARLRGLVDSGATLSAEDAAKLAKYEQIRTLVAA